MENSKSKKENKNSNRDERIKEILNTLPKKSGVYLMRNNKQKIIYIGKAKNLKNRVSQYFSNSAKIKRTEKMVENVDNIEYIVTSNETEAFLLEANLIKKYKPKYNVLLKDDKAYPYLQITDEDFPTLIVVRKKKKDKAKYFGPYPYPSVPRDLIKIVQRKFKIRTKKPFKYRKRPCLNYEMNLCDAPCIGNISKEEYAEKMIEVNKFLSGNFKDIQKELETEMLNYAKEERFEKAAELRDIITKLKKVGDDQKISNYSFNAIDAVGMQRDGLNVAIEIFEIRNSKMNERKRFKFKNPEHLKDDEVLAAFLKQYYIQNLDIPNKIIVREDFEEREELQNVLKEEAGYKVEINVPKKGKKNKFLELAEENATIYLNENNTQKEILEELKQILDLKNLPLRIEMYDVSNISGTNTVSAMVVMESGEINKKLTRRFKFTNINMQNDYLVTKETILRRMMHNIKGKTGLGDFPDLIIADGGINQINAIKEALQTLDLDIPVYGLVKNEKHKTRALIDENKYEYILSDETMLKLSNMQEEVHNAAIKYHRSLRDKEMLKSDIDNIPGIGEVLKAELLKEFKSLENIKEASIEELTKIKGISEKKAKEILKSLNE